MGKRSKENFLWFISLFSIAGIALGVTCLMLVLGVMNGFSHDLKEKIIGANPTITIEGHPAIDDYEALAARMKKEEPEVKGVSPFIASQVIYRSSSYMVGGVLRAVVPETESTVTNVAGYFKSGGLNDLNRGLVLGGELAKELEVGVGDPVWVLGGLAPVGQPFKVTGIIECGVYSFDASVGMTSLGNVQQLFALGKRVHGLGIRTDNIYRSEEIAARLRKIVPGHYTVSTWIQKNKILFAALALEKKAMAIILVMIVLVASFNIASTLMITVFRKTREIGILKALGLTSNEIGRIFFLQGMILGLEGLAAGLAVGGFLSYLLRKYQFIKLPEYVYNLSRLPIDLSLMDVTFIALAVIAIVGVASVYPAYRASRLKPVEALRYE